MKVMETTAAIYLRKSTEDDGKSVAAQERQLRTKAGQLGIDTAALLFYLFRLEVHGLQKLRRTLGQSIPVDVALQLVELFLDVIEADVVVA